MRATSVEPWSSRSDAKLSNDLFGFNAYRIKTGDPPSRSLEDFCRLEETSRKPRGARGTQGTLEEASRKPRRTDRPRGSSRNVEELYASSRKPRGTVPNVEEASRKPRGDSRKARGASRKPRGASRNLEDVIKKSSSNTNTKEQK